jgi:ferric-dicitrate binding protein FerR (iron transport regulator)
MAAEGEAPELLARGTMVGGGQRLGTRTLRGILWWASVFATIFIVGVLVRPSTSHHTATTTTYATGVGEQAMVTLTDGTRLTLAPQTTLRLVGFGTRARTVALDGEAYVEVAHATGVPFVVHSNGVRVQVLGTAFLMRHYQGERYVHVAVAEGKVRVQSPIQPHAGPDRGVTLVRGRMADVSDSTIMTTAIDESISEADWADGKLRFYDTPLPRVLATLNRWYGYEFRLTDSALVQTRVTLVLSTRSSTTMLAVLEQLLHVNLAVAGDTVTITPRASRRPSGSPRLHNYDVWTPIRELGR